MDMSNQGSRLLLFAVLFLLLVENASFSFGPSRWVTLTHAHIHTHMHTHTLSHTHTRRPHNMRLFIRKDWYKTHREQEMVVVDFEAGDDVRDKMQAAIAAAGLNISVENMLLPTSPTSKAFVRAQGEPLVDSRTFNRGEEFGRQSLRDISRLHYFSIAYLGDYVCSLGAAAPINVDRPVGEYLNGEQLYSLITALTTLSPHEANEKYTDGATTLLAIARDCDVDVSFLTKRCEEMETKVPLPFGAKTRLHSSLVSALLEEIKGLREYGGYESVPRFRRAKKKSDEEREEEEDREGEGVFSEEDLAIIREGATEVKAEKTRRDLESIEYMKKAHDAKNNNNASVAVEGDRLEERFFRDGSQQASEGEEEIGDEGEPYEDEEYEEEEEECEEYSEDEEEAAEEAEAEEAEAEEAEAEEESEGGDEYDEEEE